MKRFMTNEPRAWCTQTFQCHASPQLFLPWDEMTSAERNEFEKNGSIPCEGGGVPGPWCEQCRFGRVQEPDVEVFKQPKRRPPPRVVSEA